MVEVRSNGLAQISGEVFKLMPHLIPHPAKDRQLLRFRAGSVSGIIEWPVMPLHLPRKDRTGLIRIAADGDDRTHWLF